MRKPEILRAGLGEARTTGPNGRSQSQLKHSVSFVLHDYIRNDGVCEADLDKWSFTLHHNQNCSALLKAHRPHLVISSPYIGGLSIIWARRTLNFSIFSCMGGSPVQNIHYCFMLSLWPLATGGVHITHLIQPSCNRFKTDGNAIRT